jgi:hypothetical protein
MKTIYLKEGIAGLFKGNATNCMRIAPYTAIEFYMFEVNKWWINNLLDGTHRDVRWTNQQPSGWVAGWRPGLHCRLPDRPGQDDDIHKQS